MLLTMFSAFPLCDKYAGPAGLTSLLSRRHIVPDRQQVSVEDAERLAEALKRALEKIPDGRGPAPKRGRAAKLSQFIHWHTGLTDFAEFCRRGAFRIYPEQSDSVY
jgi:hypothetical protein